MVEIKVSAPPHEVWPYFLTHTVWALGAWVGGDVGREVGAVEGPCEGVDVGAKVGAELGELVPGFGFEQKTLYEFPGMVRQPPSAIVPPELEPVQLQQKARVWKYICMDGWMDGWMCVLCMHVCMYVAMYVSIFVVCRCVSMYVL